MAPESPEIVLTGGFSNDGLVCRVGDSVRRPRQPTSPATHALLAHLERTGFDGAPRFLGVDEQGRDVLSYVHGEAATAPHPAWAYTDDSLVSVAKLLRRYHEAVASFDARPHRWPQSVPAAYRDGLVSHNDPNPGNVVFSGNRAVALIDFDLAAPGSAVWDVACAARLWAPLRDERDAPAPIRGRSLERLRLFVDAYGLCGRDRVRTADAVACAHEWTYDIILQAVERGHEAFKRRWLDGDRTKAHRTRTWIQLHRRQIRAALCAA